MKTDRREFIKAAGAAVVVAGVAPAAKAGAAVAGARGFKKITIAKTSCRFEREPMKRPFGFKGG